jgi:ribosomal protein S18 acetylase RimI-like enzyme
MRAMTRGPMNIQIRAMMDDDLEQVIDFWNGIEGIGGIDGETPEALSYYLDRNPGMSFVALDGDTLIGAVLSGHDGRRGYINHLAVAKSYRGQDIGKELVECCLQKLESIGIPKCHIFVYQDNEAAQAFWERVGWVERSELLLMSKNLSRNR